MKCKFKIGEHVVCPAANSCYADSHVLVVRARKKISVGSYLYFLGKDSDPPGYGVWVHEFTITRATCLDIIADSGLND